MTYSHNSIVDNNLWLNPNRDLWDALFNARGKDYIGPFDDLEIRVVAQSCYRAPIRYEID